MSETTATTTTLTVYLASDPAIESFTARHDADPDVIAARAAAKDWTERIRAAPRTQDLSTFGPCPVVPECPSEKNYILTRDLRDARLVADAKPVAFHIRRLTMGEAAEVRRQPAGFDQALAAFARGLVRVDNYAMDSGASRTWTRPDDGSGQSKPIPMAAIDAAFDLATVEEIGGVVLHRSFFSRTPSARLLPLPDISHAGLQASLLLRAGQTRASSRSAATNEPAKTATAETSASSSPSEPPTDATALVATPPA